MGRKRSGGGGATGAERTADGSIACAARRAEGGGARSAQRGAEPELRGERPAADVAARGWSGEHGPRQKQRRGGLPRATGSGCCERSRDVPGAVAV